MKKTPGTSMTFPSLPRKVLTMTILDAGPLVYPLAPPHAASTLCLRIPSSCLPWIYIKRKKGSLTCMCDFLKAIQTTRHTEMLPKLKMIC